MTHTLKPGTVYLEDEQGRPEATPGTSRIFGNSTPDYKHESQTSDPLRHADNPQEQAITVAPLNVEEGYRSAGARTKSYLFPTTKVSQVLVDYALNKFKLQVGRFNGWKFNVTSM